VRADNGGNGVHVDRDGGVHGDQGADSDRAVVLGHGLRPERRHDMHRMSDAGVVPLESESGRAGTVHLDGPRGQAGQLRALVLAAGPEVRLDHHGRSVGR